MPHLKKNLDTKSSGNLQTRHNILNPLIFTEKLAKQAAELAAHIKSSNTKKDPSNRKRSRKSLSCISVKQLTTCRPS